MGMGRDLYEAYPTAKAVFDEADERLGFSLSRLCFEGPEDELRKTVNAQPALVTVSFACLRAAQESAWGMPSPAFMAGHSLGEYTALAAAGVLDFADTVYLARERGRLMYEAGLVRPGGMAAIIGLDEGVLAEVCRETDTRIANINCPGQLVISGAIDNVAWAVDMAKEKGASRAIPLEVSGAFHTPLMQPAVDGLADIIPTIDFREPAVPIIGNTSGRPLTTVEAIKAELLEQLCNSVQWQASIEYMLGNGVTSVIEIGPGRVLAGLMRRIDRSVDTRNMGDAEAVSQLRDPSP